MLTQIVLTQFKIHKATVLSLGDMLSVLTGENNSGKSSLLEAILIFQECYRITLTQIQRSNAKSVKAGQLQVGQYEFRSEFISAFASVRSENYLELFYQQSNTFNITVKLQLDEHPIELGFEVTKARNQTAYQITPQINAAELLTLNRYKPTQLISVIKSSPVASIVRNESYLHPCMLDKVISENATSHATMRNRLLRLNNQHRLDELQSQLRYIMGYDHFELRVQFDMNRDLYITAEFRRDSGQSFQDIAMLGSGTLQMLEVLISLNLQRDAKVRIVLLDEPDSYLHRHLQNQLLAKLRDIAINGVQIITTTHNEQIIAACKLSELLHLADPAEGMRVQSLSADLPKGRRVGLLASVERSRLYQRLGISGSAMSVLEAVEADVVVLVEGETDATLIAGLQARREQIFPVSSPKKVAFWSLNGISDLANKLKYWQELLSQIKNERSIWQKSVLVLDDDFLSHDETRRLGEVIKKRHHIDTLFWGSYTIESTLLANQHAFAKTLAKMFQQNHENIYQRLQNLIVTGPKLTDKIAAIEGQRKARSADFAGFDDKSLIQLTQGNAYVAYRTELEAAPNDIHRYYDKKDVFELLQTLYLQYREEYNQIFTPSELDCWLEVLSNTDASEWQPQWTQLLRRIYG